MNSPGVKDSIHQGEREGKVIEKVLLLLRVPHFFFFANGFPAQEYLEIV